MNPMAAAAIGSVVRWVLAIGAGYLIHAGIWTPADASLYVTAATCAIVSLGWSELQKRWSHQQLLVALATPGVTTQAAVRAVIASGAAIPALSTPVNAVPVPVPQP